MPTTDKSEDEWREKLTPEQYRILREAGTEPPFSGELLTVKDAGEFRCAGCGQPLFSSETKYDSGSGWPSFTAPMGGDKVEERSDTSHGMTRTEVLCSACGGHLGHVFPDGPGPDGLRYCINSAALDFRKAEDEGQASDGER
jgi:peptide-methionine (R)-S-oxide reductase